MPGRIMTSVFILILIVLLAVGFAAALMEHDKPSVDHTSPPAPAKPLSFVEYLLDPVHQATLVGYSPLGFDPTNPAGYSYPTLDSIRADLQMLRSGFDGLVLYSYDDGVTPNIVAEAVDEGYRAILLGIWNPRSEEELDGTVRLMQTYSNDIALAICVGNEGITFNRYTLDDVWEAREYLHRALGPHLRVPICTSEPLSRYGEPRLQAFGDFLAPNIHPVFDRPHLRPEGAAYWTREVALRLAQRANKPVLVKETGFPHAGAPRFSPETQRRFWQAYTLEPLTLTLSDHPPIWISHAAAFEAFNQPWKAQVSLFPLEGAWGLFDHSRNAYPAFSIWLRSH